MRTSNIRPIVTHTYEGAPTTVSISKETELRRAVLTCLLWEKEFYKEGAQTADRIRLLASNLPFEKVADLALEAREKYKLRHVPLWLLVSLIDSGHKGNQVSEAIAKVIQRPDEMVELLSLYWKAGKKPLTKQLKRGLAKAFKKFNEYSLAKFDKPGAISIRDVMFLSHPCPDSPEQEALFKRVANKELKTPDTWEVQLSAGADKGATFVRLIGEQKLGPQAMLRNLRNMIQANVGSDAIRMGLKNVKTDRVLPFEFITAARHAKQFEPELEELMFKCLAGNSLPGKTTLLLDRSGSMNDPLSSGRKNIPGTNMYASRFPGQGPVGSELTRYDAAAGLAMLLREESSDIRIFTFQAQGTSWGNAKNVITEIPPRRGFALRDALGTPQGGTLLGDSVSWINKNAPSDRLIVLTDEQSQDVVPGAAAKKSYMINVATYEKSVGIGNWVRIAGWSEAIVDFIKAHEAQK